MRGYGAGKIDRLPSNRFRVRVPDGAGGYVSLGTFDTLAEAERMRAAGLIARQRVVVYDTVARFGDRVIESWRRAGKRSHAADASRWQTWVVDRAAWAHEPIGAVTRSMVRDWCHGLLNASTSRGKPASEQTIKHTLVLVRRVFAEAVRDELILVNPAADVEAPTRNEVRAEHWDALSAAEFEAAITCPDLRHHQRAAIALACLTGLRQGELAALCWDDVRDLDGSAPHLMVRRSWDGPPKNGRSRRVDLVPRAAEWLRSLPRTDANVWGVEHSRGYDWGWGDTTDRTRGVTWLGVRRRLGITRAVTWHHLRDTCASHLLTGTWGRAWTIAEVAALLGHSSTWVTERYGRLLPGALASAAAATTTEANPVVVSTRLYAATGHEPATRGGFAREIQDRPAASGAKGRGFESPTACKSTGHVTGSRTTAAETLLRTVASGEPVAEALIAELVSSVLGRDDVRLAQRLAAGEGPRVMLAVRLAESVLGADVAADGEVGNG